MGLTRLRAEQISDIDYKQAVRVITISNVTLSGGAPSQVDGVNLSADDRILVNGQSTGSQNGIYQVDVLGTGSNGTWIRSTDTNATGELDAGAIVMVTEGTVYKDTQWKLTTNNPIVIGTTALTFEQNSAFAFGNVFANGTAVLATTVGDALTLAAGNNIQITGNNSAKSVTIAVTGISLNSISNGTSNVNVVSSGGNVTVGVAGTNNVAVFASNTVTFAANLLPSANVTYSLGSNTVRWKDLWVANSSIYIGDVTLATTGNSLTINGANVLTGNAGSNLSTTGNVIGGNISTTGLVTATGNVTGGNLLTAGLITSTGNIQGGNIRTAGQVSATGSIYGIELFSTQSSGDEGGQINLAIPATNTTLQNIVTIDVFQNRLRFFEGSANAKGAFIDLSACGNGASTNLLAGGSGGSPGGSNTQVQFNDSGVFGGNAQFTYNKTTNTLTAGIISSSNNGNGTNFQVGDDAYIGDINTADTISIRGQQNAANGFIVFGNADSTGKLGRAGSGPLTYAGAFSATGNITGGNILGGANVNATTHTGTTVSVTANITGGNVLTGGLISATSTITSAANVAGLNITTGGNMVATGNLSGGNVAATTTVFSFGTVVGTGNTSGGNLTTAGLITATGNIQGGNLRTAGLITATGAITGAAISGTSLSASGNVDGGNLRTAGLISATGTVTGSSFSGAGTGLTGTASSLTVGTATTAGTVTTAAQPNITSVGTLSSLTVTANISGGNLLTAGLLSATGNVTGGNILTAGLISAAGNITSGNVSGTRGAFTNLAGTLETAAQTNVTSLGTLTGLNVTASNVAVNITDSFNTATATKNLRVVSGSRDFAMIANIGGGSYNSLTTANDSAIIASGPTIGNAGITIAPWAGATSGIRISSASNVATITLAATTISVTGNIVNGQANGVGNIGNATGYFNTIFARATSAQYADLAEIYVGDVSYDPGTLVEFGGANEVTVTTQSHSTRVAGIVSTNPSYLMNATQTGNTVMPVALTGRVPCSVVGTIVKGDRLVASDQPGVARALDKNLYEPGCIIGKALENYNSDQIGIIEVAVGRF